ncbi:low temperature requirement protein A [Allomesorhizobium camelthorni]|nr:low temperature requirement protein A [Mesorhizobium camelthorni]
MPARDPNEVHRQASFLELFFDLCFVIAVAQAASSLHHALAEEHFAAGILSYLTVFFAIWWAWMNFTWFASSYDNDDVPYRVAAMVQIVGALILAAGVPRAFEIHQFDVVFLGYAVMRVGLVALWLRAAMGDTARRITALRYAGGISAAMIGWAVMLFSGEWPLWGWWLMAAVEMTVPIWAERGGNTPWHPHHIAERYGLFTIIVLGESVLATTLAVQSALGDQGASPALLRIIGGGLLIVFSLWWLYFAKPAQRFLTSNRLAFLWGYGHYFIFASVAAVGAGLAVNVDHVTGHSALSNTAAGAAVTVPVAVYLFVLWMLHIRPHRTGLASALLFLATVAVILVATFSPWPIPIAGLATAALVAISVALSAHLQR